MGSSLIWPGGFLCTNPPLVLMYLNLLQQVTSTAVVPSCPSVFLTSIFLCSSSTVTHILLLAVLITTLLFLLFFLAWFCTFSFQSPFHNPLIIEDIPCLLQEQQDSLRCLFLLSGQWNLSQATFLLYFPLPFLKLFPGAPQSSLRSPLLIKVLCSWCLEKCIFSYIRWRHCYSIFLADQWLL